MKFLSEPPLIPDRQPRQAHRRLHTFTFTHSIHTPTALPLGAVVLYDVYLCDHASFSAVSEPFVTTQIPNRFSSFVDLVDMPADMISGDINRVVTVLIVHRPNTWDK